MNNATTQNGEVGLTGAAPRNIRDMVELEQREKVRMTFSDHIADLITRFGGSMLYVWLHVAWFAIWIGVSVLGLSAFDPYPFGLLTMIVSLEAIFLSTFVLISENRQALLSDKRAKLDLQVNLIAEEEVTKLLAMVEAIHEHLGLGDPDPEIKEMEQPTHLQHIADAMEAVEAQIDKEAAKGSESAADTDA